jgi:hypothetical protein
MAFVKHDQPDIVDEGGVVAQGEVELLRCRDDDLAGAQRVFVAGGYAAGAIE